MYLISDVSGVAEFGDLDFSSVSCGTEHTCGVVKNTDHVQCWGMDAFGQISGYIHGYIHTSPQGTPPGDTEFSSVSCGMYHTCGVVKNTNNVQCWGDD